MTSPVAAESKKKLRFGVLLLVVGLVAGASFFTAAVILTINQRERADWPRTTGTVSELVLRLDRDSQGHLRNTYGEVVTYEVDGHDYTRQPQSYARHPNPIGTEVTVHYDPNDPSRSHVGGENWWLELAMVGGGLVFLGLMAGFGLVLVRTEVKARRLRESVGGPRS